MADDVTSQKTIDDQTSMGAYLLKQAYQQTITWGSLLGGGYLGILAGNAFSKTSEVLPARQAWWNKLPVVSKLPGLKAVPTDKALMWGGGAGAVLGGMIAGVVLGYEHWKKIKQSQLQVDEITKDISDIEVFKKTDPELAAENKRLWAELHKREAHAAKPHEEKEKPHHPTHRDGDGEGHAAKHLPKSTDHASHHLKHESWQDKAKVESQQEHEAQR